MISPLQNRIQSFTDSELPTAHQEFKKKKHSSINRSNTLALMKLELPLRIDLTVAKSQFSTNPNSWGDKLNSQIQKQCMNTLCPYDFADLDGGNEKP